MPCVLSPYLLAYGNSLFPANSRDHTPMDQPHCFSAQPFYPTACTPLSPKRTAHMPVRVHILNLPTQAQMQVLCVSLNTSTRTQLHLHPHNIHLPNGTSLAKFARPPCLQLQSLHMTNSRQAWKTKVSSRKIIAREPCIYLSGTAQTSTT